MIASRVLKRLLLPMLVLVAALAPAPAWANDTDVQTVWRLLDYVGVDYGGAVADGHNISTRSEETTSGLQLLMRVSSSVLLFYKKTQHNTLISIPQPNVIT